MQVGVLRHRTETEAEGSHLHRVISSGVRHTLKGMTEYPDCCINCMRKAVAAGERSWWEHPTVLCMDCGNKRCPKATDHRLACTGSNEPGQPGSEY